MSNKNEFWITNISNRNVTLSDLNISIPAKSSVNLLDSKRYYFKEEQLMKSLNSGSLFIKRDKLFKRIIPPPENKENKIIMDHEAIIPSKARSIYEIKQEQYEELNISDDEFAEQNVELSELERKPFIGGDK